MPMITERYALEKKEFDINQESNFGKPYYWDLDTHVKSVIQMICSDEIEIAMSMLDNIPAWYREQENYPKVLTEIKNILYEQLYDPYEYSNESAMDESWTKEDLIKQGLSNYFFPRGTILAEQIRKMNHEGLVPWIFEMSPSHGSMILGFIELGLKFEYFAKNLNAKATDKLKTYLPENIWKEHPSNNQKTILICYEAMEHSYREQDIEQCAKKIGISFDEIYFSVPYGCLYGGLPDWNTRKLGHVRGYTSNDFIEKANKFFKGYTWEFYKHHSMVLKGIKNG